MKLVGERIYVRPPETVTDAEARFAVLMRNREFFKKYEPTRDEAYFQHETQMQVVEKCKTAMEQDSGYYFGIYLQRTDEYIGEMMLAQVMRGPFQSAILGYSFDQAHNGKGYCTEAARLVVAFAFEELKLHRVTAGVAPHNIGSWRVLEKIGFQREGLNRKMLEINGQWEDMYMYTILDSDYEELRITAGEAKETPSE